MGGGAAQSSAACAAPANPQAVNSTRRQLGSPEEDAVDAVLWQDRLKGLGEGRTSRRCPEEIASTFLEIGPRDQRRRWQPQVYCDTLNGGKNPPGTSTEHGAFFSPASLLQSSPPKSYYF